MTTLKVLKQENYRVQPWKNGLGFTSEIAIFPPAENFAEGSFLWRISSAKITESGSFSSFPDYDRKLIVFGDGGLSLQHGEKSELLNLKPLAVHSFDGALQTRCELLGGPVTDLSVFSRKERIRSSVKIVQVKNDDFYWKPSGHWNFLFSVSGRYVVQSLKQEESLTLSTGGALSHDLAAEKTFTLRLQEKKLAHLISVEINPVVFP